MARRGFLQRHRVALASSAALVLATGAVVGYAITADGYQTHRAQLNDGGIWVTNGKDGLYGRVNKPINQLDAAILADREDLSLDVIQEGAAVIGLDRRSSTAQIIDPATGAFADGPAISVPTAGSQWIRGGTFASVDAETGSVWAVQVDPQRGKPVINSVDRQADPLVEVGEAASMTVTTSGRVVAVSAEKGTITEISPAGETFAKPVKDDIPDDAGSPTELTSVGERVVSLDADSGTLRVLDGTTAEVPVGAVLQQPGPAAGSVLLATPDQLLAIDLDSGAETVITDVAVGRPVAPVRLGACQYGAWSGGQGLVVVACDGADVQTEDLNGDASNLALRVNRGEIVLNDGTTGAVWDLDTPQPERIDNWSAFTATKKVEDKDKKNEEQSQGDRRPPKAKPDDYGARPGRVTVLHPLDNDSAPDGRLLSIVDVDQPTGGSSVEISPDGQTLVLSMPNAARDTSFEYFINDGRTNFSANARVSVQVRENAQNAPPALRKGHEARTWRVPADGALSVPVLADWRDDNDGDSLVLDSASVVGAGDSGATARTTSDGRVRFTGSRDGGENFQVEYSVSDGRSAPVKKSLIFEVQERLDRNSFPAIAEPDVVRGEVGKPIKIRPLLNDLPGSDPGTPNAELQLGGKIPSQADADIRTDLENGVITFTGHKPQTYFLDYDAGFGNADLARNTVRVDVRPRPKSPGDPVAMPDSISVFGQAPGIVDVLSNDLDPAGGLLVVQRARALNPSQVDVAVIDGRWLRISARQSVLSPNPQVVRYEVSNGSVSGVVGEVTVYQRPTPEDNSPVTTADRVVVRAGTATNVAVLDNDISPSGDQLSLLADSSILDERGEAIDSPGAAEAPGELEIDVPVDMKGDVGKAFVAGRTVRYIAPELKERDSFTVRYVAVNTAGEPAMGRLTVIVVPADEHNDPPEPPTLEARLVAGGATKIKLPGSGVDPNGDPVTIGGIVSAPKYGRILSFGGNFLEYQAYPRVAGTDEFEYTVVDSHGAVATATVRVAVVPPGQPQPPLAVPDRLTVEPGRTAVFDPLANDYVAPGDDVRIELRTPPKGVSLDEDTGLVSVQAPEDRSVPAPEVVYEITNGLDSSISTLNLDLADNYNNPPVVYDAFGTADDSASVSVDVLEGAYDPDGDIGDLQVTKVYGTTGSPVVRGDQVKATRGKNPIVVPFRVEDADGGAASSSLYVPPTGTGIPYVKTGAVIELDEGGSMKGKLSDYIVNPSGGTLRLAGRGAVSASPLMLQGASTGENSFELSSRAGFRGPGALLLRVTTATDPSGNEDPADPTDGYTALLSVPVQVGDDTPILQCPETVIPIVAGDTIDFDVQARCNVWTLDPADATTLDYRGTWDTRVPGVEVEDAGGPVLSVTAADDANEGGLAVLSVTAGDSEPDQISFRLADAPPPTMLPIKVADMDAGQTREYDLARYLQAGVSTPEPRVVSISPVAGSGVTASVSGPTSVTFRAGANASGRTAFRVVMSDIAADDPPASRRAEGMIEFSLAGLPSAPGTPLTGAVTERGSMFVQWTKPKNDGGSPITSYKVKEIKHGAGTITCRAPGCDFPRLDERKSYAFEVAAVNAVGQGPWSTPSKSSLAATQPGRVPSIRMTGRGDHTITLAWGKPVSVSEVEAYNISWQGQAPITVSGSQRTYTATVPDNNRTYVFSIEAKNAVGWSGPRQSAPFQALGTPASPGGVRSVDNQTGVSTTSVTTTWNSTLPEGPGPTTYTVSYSVNGGAARPVPGCVKIQSLSCTQGGLSYDGSGYTYSVQAHNVSNTSAPTTGPTLDLVGKPANWGSWQAVPTGQDNMIRVTGTVPEPRGSSAQAQILVAGQRVWRLGVSAGTIINEVVRTPDNAMAYDVQLVLCNENAAKVGCTMSDPKSVQSYGPLTRNHLADPTATVDGKNITWTISASGNGDPATVGISVDGAAETFHQVGATQQTFTHSYAVAEFGDATSITVRLFDSSPTGRGEVTAYSQTRAGNLPTPTIGLSKRVGCDDDDADANNNCNSTPPCIEASCGFMNITATGTRSTFSCWVSAQTDGRPKLPLFDLHEGTNETNWVFEGGHIEVTCEGGQGALYFKTSATMTW